MGQYVLLRIILGYICEAKIISWYCPASRHRTLLNHPQETVSLSIVDTGTLSPRVPCGGNELPRLPTQTAEWQMTNA